MRRPTVKMGVAAVGTLVLVASVNLPAAQGAMWGRAGGTYYSWQAGRNVNQSWNMPRGSQSIWNWGNTTGVPAAGSVTITQPVSTYHYVLKNRQLMTAVSTYTAIQAGGVLSVSTGYLKGIQDLHLASVSKLDLGTVSTATVLPISTLYPGSIVGSGSTGCVLTDYNYPGSGTLTLGGTNTHPGGSISSDSVTVGGLVNYAGSASSIQAINSGYYGGSSGAVTLTVVPEPTSVGLLLCGVGGLLRRRRR